MLVSHFSTMLLVNHILVSSALFSSFCHCYNVVITILCTYSCLLFVTAFKKSKVKKRVRQHSGVEENNKPVKSKRHKKSSTTEKTVNSDNLSLLSFTQTTILDFASRSSEDPKDSEDYDHNSWRDLDTDSSV